VAFAYTSGNPDNLIGGQPAAMVDIRGPFGDLKTFLNSGVLDPIAALKAPVFAAGNVTVGEVGVSGQLRAGHTLASTDFTAQGLAVPLGLWNLSDLTDASGNGRALVNKGSVPFGVGINGAATTAAVFAGSTGQALYIADTGAADPFRIKTGSWGCWFRTAKRAIGQSVLFKGSAVSLGYSLQISASNIVSIACWDGATTLVANALGTSDVCDDRWHFIVATQDGTKLRAYLDGALEASVAASGAIGASSGPLNVGGQYADGSTAATQPHYGRVDEAFVTSDVLSEDQIRNLYAARITHTLTVVPGDVRILVRRRRRGGALATTDFPTTPVRLHNFTGGSLTDQGSGGVALAPVGGGSIVAVSGADGALNGGQSFSGAHTGLGATDAGLPAGLTARSFGAWFKTTTATAVVSFIGWGSGAATAAGAWVGTGATGGLLSQNGADQMAGPFVADGLWHHVVVVEDNAAGDGVKRKGYLDGRLVIGSTVLNTLTLGGANRFRVGATADGAGPMVGQIDGAFVHSVALTGEQVRALWNVGSQQLAPSPKDATDHVEAVTSTDLLAVLDTIESSDSVDLIVAP
jgi:hypothetical protein